MEKKESASTIWEVPTALRAINRLIRLHALISQFLMVLKLWMLTYLIKLHILVG